MKDIFAEREEIPERKMALPAYAESPPFTGAEGMFTQVLLRKAQRFAGDIEDLGARLSCVRALERHLDMHALPHSVEMPAYLRMLNDDMVTLFSARRISLVVRCDRGTLSAQAAARVGLLIFELCLNSVQHAFTGRTGSIQVRYRTRGHVWQISVIDDGEGFPKRSHPIFCAPIADLLVALMRAHIKRKSNGFGTEISVSGRV